MKRITLLLTAGLIAVATALPAAAYAQDASQHDQVQRHDPDAALERVKAHAQTAVERRLNVLDRLTDAVAANDHISADHQSELLADYTAAEEGLTDLNAEIQVATTLAEVLDLTPKIATDYRAFLVIVPKSHGVLASEAVAAAGDRISEVGVELQEAIDRASDAEIDPSEAQALLDDALADGAAAASMADPVAEDVIGLTASDWPEPAHDALHGARETLHEAGELTHSAVRGLRAAGEALRSAIRDHHA